ncbi:hypothetical protein ACFL6I_09565 [candidate division KSB1 bacterium]
MQETVEFFSMKPKVFEIDKEGIEKRLEVLRNNGSGSEAAIEYNILQCFSYMGHCLRVCRDYETPDVLAKKSCKDCLDRYVREIEK